MKHNGNIHWGKHAIDHSQKALKICEQRKIILQAKTLLEDWLALKYKLVIHDFSSLAEIKTTVAYEKIRDAVYEIEDSFQQMIADEKKKTKQTNHRDRH